MTILEVLSAGLPVLSSDRGAHGALLRQFSPEWVVPSDETVAWCSSFRTIVQPDYESALDDFSDLARKVYSEQFSETTALQRLPSVYWAEIISMP
jgi:hypothetical protein